MNSSDDEVFSQMDDEELRRLEQEAEQPGTASATKWAMDKFLNWIRKRKIACDLETIEKEELGKILHQFYGEQKNTKTSKALSPSTLNGLRAGIQRGICQLRHDIHIVNDREFMRANKILNAKCRLYAKQGNPKPQHKEEIAEHDLQKIAAYLSQDETMDNPRRLQQAVWFIIAFSTGARGREMYRQLQRDGVGFHRDDAGKEYFSIDQCVVEKNHPGGLSRSDLVSSRPRIYDSVFGETSFHAVIRLYQSKLNTSCTWFFQQPKNQAILDGPWYKNLPVGVNTVAQMMTRIGTEAGLSGTYTNHCVRATTITHLFRAGVSPASIISRTGHKSTESLKPYIGQSSHAQMRQEADVLGNAFGDVAGPSNVSVSGTGNEETDGKEEVSVAESLTQRVIAGSFTNCNITVNVTYNTLRQ